MGLTYNGAATYDSVSFDYWGNTLPSPTISLVQNTHGSTSGASVKTFHLGSNVSAGNFLVAAIAAPSTASVSSITDSLGNRWIQTGYSFTAGGNAELWTARGVAGGSASVAVAFNNSASVGASVGVNISEWSGVWWVDPLDQWSQNVGTSNLAQQQAATPRVSASLVISVVSTAASISAPTNSLYTALTVDGTGHGAAYYTGAASVTTATTNWNVASSQTWGTVAAAFRPGPAGINPNLQFPETLVQVCTQTQYLNPLNGIAVWTNISSYVRNMSLGPIGRQHELDRVQAASAQFTVNNRDGSFNTWNTNSFLYNNGNGLKPMNPVKVTTAWNGITTPQYYGYMQSVTPSISDVMNVDVTISCVDIFQMFSLGYLSNNNYSQHIFAAPFIDPAQIRAYYRLGDAVGSQNVIDSSGNGNNGSLLAGPSGMPAYGQPGAFLNDSDTAIDLTNGSNLPNGGILMIDNTTQPPTDNSGYIGFIIWDVSMWFKWTGANPPSPGVTPNGVLFSFTTGPTPFQFQIGYQKTLSGVTLTNAIMLVTNNASGGIGPFENGFFANLNIFDGQWHYLAVGAVSNIGWVTLDGNTTEWSAGIFVGSNNLAFGTPNGTAVPSGGLDPTAPNAVAFTGLMDEIVVSTTSNDNHATGYSYGTWFQNVEVGAVAGSTPDASRLSKVIAVMGLPDTCLVVPYPFKTQLYIETNPVTTTSALNYIQTMTETEPGIIFQGPDGSIYAYNRQYQYLNPTSTTSQAVISDSTGSPYFYDGTQLQIVQDDLDIFNTVQVQSGRSAIVIPASAVLGVTTPAQTRQTAGVLQEWGPAQAPDAAVSAAAYGTRTMQGLTSLQFNSDSDALAVAQNYEQWYAEPLARVQQVVLNSQGNSGNNLTAQLQLGVMDRVTIQYQGQTSSPVFSQDSLIESIAHDVDLQQPTWTTTFQLSPYELLFTPWVFGKSGQDAFGGPQVLTL